MFTAIKFSHIAIAILSLGVTAGTTELANANRRAEVNGRHAVQNPNHGHITRVHRRPRLRNPWDDGSSCQNGASPTRYGVNLTGCENSLAVVEGRPTALHSRLREREGGAAHPVKVRRRRDA